MVFGRKKHQNAPSASAPPPPPGPQYNAAAGAGSAYQPTSAAHGAQPTARTLARESDRTMRKAQRDMERERMRLDAEERRIKAEVKALGSQGRMAEARMLAKNLVQVRNAKARTFQAGAHMNAIGNQAKMAQADAAMMDVMGRASEVMKNTNSLANPEKQMNMVQEFDMQTEKYKLGQEMTDEVLDSVLGGEDVDAETDDVLGSVLDEIGFELAGKGSTTPVMRPQQVQTPQHQAAQADDAALMDRIAKLG